MLHIETKTLNWELMADMGDEDLGVYVPKDSVMFRRIRDVLLAHDLLDTFGIYLVHKHFRIAADEEMVEEVDFESQTMRVRPLNRACLDMEALVPTNWFFSVPSSGEVEVFVAQWGHAKDLANAERDPFASRYAAVFDEISNILFETDSLERFGMFLIRHQFPSEMEENLLECTDQDTRTLTITHESQQDAPGGTVATNWIFTPNAIVASACCNCAKDSSGYHRGRHESR